MDMQEQFKYQVSKHHPIRHAKSFKYAFSGLLHALLSEANFRVEVCIAVIIVILGNHFGISTIEWALLTLALGFLLSAEMVNTVVERFIDHLIKEYHEGAKVIKDLSAGFVLVAAFVTLIVFILVFGERLPLLLA